MYSSNMPFQGRDCIFLRACYGCHGVLCTQGQSRAWWCPGEWQSTQGRPEKDNEGGSGSLLRKLVLGMFWSGVLARRQLPRNSAGLESSDYPHTSRKWMNSPRASFNKLMEKWTPCYCKVFICFRATGSKKNHQNYHKMDRKNDCAQPFFFVKENQDVL